MPPFDIISFRRTVALKMEEVGVAALSVAVSNRKALLYSEGFGVENAERPVLKTTVNTRFKIASCSKMIIAALCMRLVDAGLLSLDEPVKKHIPWLSLSRSGAEEAVTLRGLLSHSAGMSTELPTGAPRDERFLGDHLKAALPLLATPAHPNEKKHFYSNYGFMLAAHLAEQVTVETYSALARRLILAPLCMNNTHFYFRECATYPWVLPHVKDENGILHVKHIVSSIETRFGSGEIFSTPEDLLKLGRLYLNGGVADSKERILSPQSVEEMLEKHVPRADDGGYHGLGIHIRPYQVGFVYGHTGTLLPYRSAMFFERSSGICVSVMVNTNAPLLRDELVETLLASF